MGLWVWSIWDVGVVSSTNQLCVESLSFTSSASHSEPLYLAFSSDNILILLFSTISSFHLHLFFLFSTSSPPPPFLLRNPVHTLRPTFDSIHDYLDSPEDSLLQWRSEDVIPDKQAHVLGAPLLEANNLYFDLQRTYQKPSDGMSRGSSNT